jgi:hypothetical protein
VYLHGASHSLNLAISDGCDLPLIRNTIYTIKVVYSFFRKILILWMCIETSMSISFLMSSFFTGSSTVRTEMLSHHICHLETTKSKLVYVCTTRWVERHEALHTFVHLYPAVLNALDEISAMREKGTWGLTESYYKTTTSSDFLMSLACRNKLLGYTVTLSSE